MPWCEQSGVSIYYEVSGSASHRTLVLAHELGGSLRSWDALVQMLENDFRIVRWDQRGSGLSEKVVAPFEMARHVDDLSAVLAEVGSASVCTLAGVAAGAAIAVLYAVRYPDDCDALILCSPALSVDPDRQVYLRERAEFAARQGMRAVVTKSLERSYPAEANREQTVFEHYRASFLSNDPVSYGYANSALAMVNAFDELRNIQCPVLLIAGKYDHLRPPDHVQKALDRLCNPAFKVIDAGHIMQVQAPDELSALMRLFMDATQAVAEV